MLVRIKVPLKTGLTVELEGNSIAELKEEMYKIPELFQDISTAIGAVVTEEQEEPVNLKETIIECEEIKPPIIPAEKKKKLTDAVYAVLDSDWARKKPRNLHEIMAVLEANALHRQKASVAGTLNALVSKNKIVRVKRDKKGMWLYAPVN